MIHRHTWYSNDKITRKINDYVLVEIFIPKYITDCQAEPEYDIDSDHRLLKTILCTPRTRKARRSQKLPPRKAQPNIKALHNPEIKNRYVEAINNMPTNIINQQVRPTEMSKRIIDIVNSVAMEILPPKSKKTTDRQLWKNDAELNKLIEERGNLHIGFQQYKNITKNIKKESKQAAKRKTKDRSRRNQRIC